MGCTRQNSKTYVKVASNDDNTPLIFGYKPFQDNTACIRFEKNHPVWRGGQTGVYSADKALAVVGDIDTKINARFSVNPLTTNRVLVSDGNGKVSPSSMTTTQLNSLLSLLARGTGATHEISTLATGLTGKIWWNVTCGICVVSLRAIRSTSTYTGDIVSSGMPKAKFGIVAPLADNGVTYGYFYVDTNCTYLKIASMTANADIYGNLVYPVADDWVES